jgi:hypothetical protein
VRAALVVLLVFLPACRTTTTSRLPGPESVSITRTKPVRAWEIWDSGRCLGSFVRFEEPGKPDRAFYSVRNREGQEIGIVDIDGRAWRYRVHSSAPDWLGSGTVFEGARRILDGSASASPVEVDVEKLREILGRTG